jgi:hypothetical protein
MAEAESWTVAEVGRVEYEKESMAARAPDMRWVEELIYHGRRAVGWRGSAPDWAADRGKPTGVDALLAGRRLELLLFYPEAFPMVPPALVPLDPEVPMGRRTLSRWHVLGDGSLCLIQAAEDWQPEHTAADLVRKASGWFIEYLLLEAGRIDRMTERGLFEDTSLDLELGGSS